MARLHILLRLFLLFHLSATTLAIPTNSLFDRQSSSDDTCPTSQSACPDLPSGLCCPSGTSCIPLAGNTTVLCCTDDTDCDRINPITCNIEQQNPDKNPLAPIKTSVFDVELSKCGDGTCCPFGFSCHEGKQCRMNKDQDEKPGKKDDEDDDGEVTSTVTGPEPTETGLDGPSSTGTEEPEETATSSPSDGDSQNEEDNDERDSSGPDTTTIIGGVVGGIAALLALAIILFVCARRRANRKPSSSSSSFASNAPSNSNIHPSSSSSTRPSQHARNFSSSSGPRGNIISEPIMQQNSYRTDFMLKTTPATASSSVASTPNQPPHHDNPHPQPLHLRNSVHPHISTVRDYDDPFLSPSPSARTSIRSSTTENNNSNRPNSRLAPIRAMRPQQHQHRAQPSSESINIFADPGTVDRQNRYSMGTTVSGLMIDLRGEGGRPNVPGTTPRI